METRVVDFVEDDFVGADATAMFENVHSASEFQTVANLTELDNGVRLREEVSFFERFVDERI